MIGVEPPAYQSQTPTLSKLQDLKLHFPHISSTRQEFRVPIANFVTPRKRLSLST